MGIPNSQQDNVIEKHLNQRGSVFEHHVRTLPLRRIPSLGQTEGWVSFRSEQSNDRLTEDLELGHVPLHALAWAPGLRGGRGRVSFEGRPRGGGFGPGPPRAARRGGVVER